MEAEVFLPIRRAAIVTCFLILHVFVFTCLANLPTVQHHLVEKPCRCDFKKGTKTLTVSCSAPLYKNYKRCFEKYKHAEHLYFQNSSLEIIPVGLHILNELATLDLSYNVLTGINFTGNENVCRNLKILTLEFNKITILKRGMLDCFGKLEQIFLRNNTLQVIENGTFNSNLSNLYNVQMFYNAMKVADTSLIYLPKLKQKEEIRVNISWNTVAYFTNSLRLTLLNFTPADTFFVDAIHNNIQSINLKYYFHIFNITNPSRLYRLWNSGFDVRFNPLICDCEMYYLATKIREFRHMDPNNPVFSITCFDPPRLRGMLVYTVRDKDFNCSVTSSCPKDCTCTESIALNLTSVTCDDKYNKNYLPVTLPVAQNLQLIITSDSLHQLSSRDYMVNISMLDVSKSGVVSIQTNIIDQLDDIKTVLLHENTIQVLPREIQKLKFNKLSTLTLHGNPFNCDCHTLWLKKWLLAQKTSEHVPHQDKIICGSGIPKGKILIRVPDSDFKCIYSLTQEEIIAIIVSCAFVLVIIVIIIYFARSQIHLYILAYISPTLFRKKTARNWLYDIFASYSSLDDAIITPIIDKLKSHIPPYKVQIDTNFSIGRPIADEIITSIESSHTTLLFLSNNFLRSKWCKMEFREAHLRFIKERRINLIVIVLEDLETSLLDSQLKEHMKWHIYLKYSDKYFWQKLLQAIPVRVVKTENTPLLRSTEN